MDKKNLKLALVIMKVIYICLCIFNIVIAIIYHYNFDTIWGSKCAYITLNLTGILFLVLLPFVLITLVFHILQRPKKDAGKKVHIAWVLGIIGSIFLFIISFTVSLGVMVAMTGGV